jgi:ribonuclease P protein component
VDDLLDDSPQAVWFACAVPKRHAKRAVTRNLIKRQIRDAFSRHEPVLPRGLWLLRLVGGFAPAQFVSARSGALAAAARAEIDALLARVATVA